MIGSVIDGHLHIADRKSAQRSFLHGFDDPFFHGGNEISRNRASDHTTLKHIPVAPWERSHFKPAIAVLPVTAGLFFVLALCLGFRLERFSVRNLRRMDDDVGSELSME